MMNLHLYDGPLLPALTICCRQKREAMGERLQERLDREYLNTRMSQAEYDERCQEIQQFVECDTPSINSEAMMHLSLQGLD